MTSKTLLLGAVLLSLAATQPAAAQTASLAPGEIPLVISARSTVHTPADLILLQARVAVRGASQAEARKLADEKVQRIVAGLVSKGVRREDVVVTSEPQPALAINAVDELDPVFVPVAPPPVALPPPVVTSPPPPVAVPAAPPPPSLRVPVVTPSSASARRASAASTIKMSLQSTSQLAAAQEVLTRESVYAGPARFSLRDDRQAKRAAIAQAIAKARDEADTHAAALEMRVTRIAKLSNEMPIGALATGVEDLLSRRPGTQEDVTTDAVVTIEFAMAPK